MKTIFLGIACILASGTAIFATPRSVDPDVVVIATAIPDGTYIRKTSWGFTVSSPSGTRNVYKTSLGYRIGGNATSPNLDIRKTSTGYRIEDNLLRGRAMGSK